MSRDRIILTRARAYTKEGSKRMIGLTKDSGWQIGVRKALPVSLQKACEFLISRDALCVWLGDLQELKIVKGTEFQLDDGTRGTITVFKPNSHIRLIWQPLEYTHPAIIQVRLISAGTKTVFAFHQEQLPSAEAREIHKVFFKQAIEKLESMILNSAK